MAVVSAQALRDHVDGILATSYELLRVERFGAFSRKTASETVLAMTSPVLTEEIIGRNRGKFSKVNRLLGRILYLRAASFWFVGQKDAARAAYEEAKKLFGSCPEKEMCDGVMD